MTDHSGQYFGRYHLLERLGEGGMAVVYRAYDTRLERDIAIKIIRSGAFPSDDLADILKRFEREAKSLAKLSHHSIVKVYDFGEHEGSPYLVMEYLPGGTLKKLLGKPIPWQDAVRLILPVARGVAYAHRRGVLHRDIKPANILITDDGEPMLSDFGIAKLFSGEQTTTLTGSGMAIGTPEYMAPEQWTGNTSPYSDLYSLGIVLYEMVAGRKPYVADTPGAILIKQVTEPLPGPRKFVVDLPEVLEQILIKTLAKEPGDRYTDVDAFISALENLITSAPAIVPPIERKRDEETYRIPAKKSSPPVPAREIIQLDGETIPSADLAGLQKEKEPFTPSTVAEKTRTPIRFSRRSIGILVGGTIILFAAWFGLPLIGKMFSSLPAERATATLTSTVPVGVESKIPLPVQVSDTPALAPTLTYTSTPEKAIFSGWKIGVLSNENGSFSVDVINPEDQTSSRFPLGENVGETLNWSPDGSKFLYSVGNNLNTFDLRSGQSNLISNSPLDEFWTMQWSPNGQTIAFDSKRESANTAVTIVNADGSGRRILDNGYFTGWSPDGQWILYKVGGWGDSGGINRVEYISPQTSEKGIVGEGDWGIWSPKGDLIVYQLTVKNSRFTSMQLFSFADRKYVGQLIDRIDGWSADYIWSSDGKSIAMEYQNKVSIVDVATKEKSQIFNAEDYNHTIKYNSVIWSPDNRKIAITTEHIDGTTRRNIFLVDRSSFQVTDLGEGEKPVFSPDGEWLAFLSTRDGDNPSLYVIRKDGSDLMRLTNDQFSHYSPYWIQ